MHRVHTVCTAWQAVTCCMQLRLAGGEPTSRYCCGVAQGTAYGSRHMHELRAHEGLIVP